MEPSSVISLKNYNNNQVLLGILESRGDSLQFKNSEISGYLKISDLNLPHISSDNDVSRSHLLIEGMKGEFWFSAESTKKLLIQGSVAFGEEYVNGHIKTTNLEKLLDYFVSDFVVNIFPEKSFR